MNDNQADILIWNTFKNGDKNAFEVLFRKYYPILIQYGSKLCQESETLRDCIQELFIELWQSKGNREIVSVKAYLLKALKYKLYRQLRSNRQTLSDQTIPEDMNFILSHDHFIVEQEEKSFNSKKIIDAVNELPNRQREIIYLKIYQGLQYEEISEIMAINYQVARNLFYQSIKSLRQIIGNGIHKRN